VLRFDPDGQKGTGKERRSRVNARSCSLFYRAICRRDSLREALTDAQAITDNFAGHPSAPPQVALALDISPTSSAWRTLTGAAVAYGLTTAGYNATGLLCRSSVVVQLLLRPRAVI
jgi:hypothetical protein